MYCSGFYGFIQITVISMFTILRHDHFSGSQILGETCISNIIMEKLFLSVTGSKTKGFFLKLEVVFIPCRFIWPKFPYFHFGKIWLGKGVWDIGKFHRGLSFMLHYIKLQVLNRKGDKNSQSQRIKYIQRKKKIVKNKQTMTDIQRQTVKF